MKIARKKLVATVIVPAACACGPAGSAGVSPVVLAGLDIRNASLTCETAGGGFMSGTPGPAVPIFRIDAPGSTLSYFGDGMTTLGLPAPPAAPREAAASDLERTRPVIPIPLNGRVLAYVDLFRGNGRAWFQEALQRGAPHLPMIQRALLAEGLPLDLAYIPIVESAFKPEAVSRAGAKGLWQFMRGTAIEQGLKYDWYIDERSHPEKSTAAAIKYLKRLNTMFDGDWHLTLASYNGGPGRVRRAMRREQSADFWPLAAQRHVLPRQTREYVPMVLAAMVIGRNPAKYGFTVTQAGSKTPR